MKVSNKKAKNSVRYGISLFLPCYNNLRMKPDFFSSGMIINMFFYKSMGSLLLFYQNFFEIFFDLFDANDKFVKQFFHFIRIL